MNTDFHESENSFVCFRGKKQLLLFCIFLTRHSHSFITTAKVVGFQVVLKP